MNVKENYAVNCWRALARLENGIHACVRKHLPGYWCLALDLI